MTINHNRRLPVPEERLDSITNQIFGCGAWRVLSPQEKMQIAQIAMQGEQVELLNSIKYHLDTAHEIFNVRYR